jgi:glycosidase
MEGEAVAAWLRIFGTGTRLSTPFGLRRSWMRTAMGAAIFGGLRQRLDYLESLGIDALWLTPFQTSPNRDDGYDIADYYSVDPRYGGAGEFVEFVHEASSRGIRVVLDLVVNHTSDRHPWFRAARRGRASAFHDWYVWADKRPPNWESGVVFPGVQKETWTYAREVRGYYFHRFYNFQPDLNMANPRVREEVRRIIGYWLQLGVAGFRVDAVPFVLENPPAMVVAPKPVWSGCASSASSSNGGSAMRCCSARRMFRRRIPRRISPTAMGFT